MFTITKYLQYRNTLDGKPSVLTEGKDYDLVSLDNLISSKLSKAEIVNNKATVNLYPIVSLKDCKELVTIRLQTTSSDDFVWTDGDVFEYQYGGKFIFSLQELFTNFLVDYSPDTSNLNTSNKKLGSFFDDPAHYSKLLWNCSKEEGWQKVFALLGIKP